MTQERDDKQAKAEPAGEDKHEASAPEAAAQPDAEADAATPAASQDGDAAPGAEAPPAEGAAPVAATPGKRTGGGVVTAVVTTLAVLLLLAGLAYVTLPQWRAPVAAMLGVEGPPAEDAVAAIAAVEARQDDLAAQVAGLRDELAALRQQMGETAAGTDAGEAPLAEIEALSARVAALEAAVKEARSAAPDAGLRRRLDALEERVAGLPQTDPAAVAALARDTEGLTESVGTLEERLAALEARAADASAVLRLSERVDEVAVTARKAAAARSDAQALLLAVAQLHAAVDAGRDYAEELRVVRQLAPDDADVRAQLDSLARHAGGIPTRSVLAASLDDLAPDIVRASIGPQEEGWWRETVQRIASLVSIKRTDDGGADSVPALVARAERAVDHGDLAQAVAFLERLEGPAAEAAAPWLAAARAHVRAQAALSDLASRAIALAGAEEAAAE